MYTFTRSLTHPSTWRHFASFPINILSRAFSSNERKRLAVSHFTLVCSIESIIFTCYVKKAIDTICALSQYIRINSNLNQAHHTTPPCHTNMCAVTCTTCCALYVYVYLRWLHVYACLSFELFLINNWSEFPIYFLDFFLLHPILHSTLLVCMFIVLYFAISLFLSLLSNKSKYRS